jgi:hypothetical protein
MVSGIVYVIRNDPQWKDAPCGYGPHNSTIVLYAGACRRVIERTFAALIAEAGEPERLKIDAYCTARGC